MTSPAREPSSTLLGAALAGLLGATLPACSDPPPAEHAAPGAGGHHHHETGGAAGAHHHHVDAGAGGAGNGDGGPGPSYSNVVSTTPVTFEDFVALCEERGGFVTTSAQCAGSNLCRGLSYQTDGTILTDHSCGGMNGCAGMSCVDLPADRGLTGEEIYEAGPCAACHNDASTGASTYAVLYGPGESPAERLAEFEASSVLRLQTLVAFGTQGVRPDGYLFSNMPSYRHRYSRAEISRVIEYIRSLDRSTKPYDFDPASPE